MHPAQQWEMYSLLHVERLQEAARQRLARQIERAPSPLQRLRRHILRLAQQVSPAHGLRLAQHR